jgi:hypothetical protein
LPHPAAPMGNYDVLDEPGPGASKSAIIGEASCNDICMCMGGACHLVLVQWLRNHSFTNAPFCRV